MPSVHVRACAPLRHRHSSTVCRGAALQAPGLCLHRLVCHAIPEEWGEAAPALGHGWEHGVPSVHRESCRRSYCVPSHLAAGVARASSCILCRHWLGLDASRRDLTGMDDVSSPSCPAQRTASRLDSRCTLTAAGFEGFFAPLTAALPAGFEGFAPIFQL